MKMLTFRAAAPVIALMILAACGAKPDEHAEAEGGHAEAEGAHGEDGVVVLTPQQITASGIQIVRPNLGGGGVIDLPATIEGDPQGMQVVSAAIGGRVVALTRNLGQTVRRGETLAVIESREAAALNAEVEAAGARAKLARSTLAREQRLFDEKVSPEQDLVAARTAATEAEIALRLARQQVAAAGGGGGGLNRLAINSPLSGQVIGRSAVLGQTVAADAELFRVANLSTVSLSLSLSPEDAGRVRPGAAVEVSAGAQRATGKVSFVSPVLDETTRLVPVIATLDNRSGGWRVGQPVTAAIALPGTADATLRVPSAAIQYVEGKTVVFVRTANGFRAAPVVAGRQDGGSVIVTSGLTGKEQIAAAGSYTLKSELGKGEAGHED